MSSPPSRSMAVGSAKHSYSAPPSGTGVTEEPIDACVKTISQMVNLVRLALGRGATAAAGILQITHAYHANHLLISADPGEITTDDHLHDFRSTAVDRLDPRVGESPADRVLVHVAVPAE